MKLFYQPKQISFYLRSIRKHYTTKNVVGKIYRLDKAKKYSNILF